MKTYPFQLDKVEGFFEHFRFLSNFMSVDVTLDGLAYMSTEHAYQAAKTLVPEEREKIRAAKSAGTAKKFGKSVTKRDDWDEVKESIMLDLLRQKFAQDPYRQLLLATGEALLEETNFWGDTYWGVCKDIGQNRLGVLLMQVRNELRSCFK